MADRWHWDFEDDERARVSSTATRPAGPPPPSEPPGEPEGTGPHVQIRRRRAVAVAVAVALVVVVALTLSQSHGSPSKHNPAPTAGSAPKAHPAPTRLPENDKQAAVASVLAYTPFIKEGTPRKPEVALTFDDGPGPYTPAVLSVLERYGVHATFFIIGRMLQYFGESARREVRDGDVLGDHTETHPALAELSAHDQSEQLSEQAARVELQGAPRPDLFRPPYGSFNGTTIAQLHRLKMLMVLWSVDTDDYEQPGVATIVQRALAGAHPGAIILMHDAGGTRTETVEALPIIIRELRAKGLKPVTVPQLLSDDPPVSGQPLPTSLAGD